MKGLSKHGPKFLIMGGGLLIILLIVYMHMRNKEGFQLTPFNLIDLNSNSWNKCGIFCLKTNLKKEDCLTMCSSKNINFCKNLGLKPNTTEFNYCLKTGKKTELILYTPSKSLSPSQNALNYTSALNNWQKYPYVMGSTRIECHNFCKKFGFKSMPELKKCFNLCADKFY